MLQALSDFISKVTRGEKIRVGGVDAQWKKVSELTPGMMIAVPSDVVEVSDVAWDEIVSIRRLPPERVFDIEVEGTHNFVAGHMIETLMPKTVAHLSDEPLRGPPKQPATRAWFGGIFAHNTTGKALATFNETGDQNILTASASGTPVLNITRSGLVQAADLTLGLNDTSATISTQDTDEALTIDPNGSGAINFHSTSYNIDSSGNLTAQQLIDSANSAYFLDPAATTSLVTAGSASISGTLTIGNAQTIRPAYGPLSLAYKSALDTWATGITLEDTTGQVGIGTTTPSQELDVVGDITLSGNIIGDTTDSLKLQAGGTGTGSTGTGSIYFLDSSSVTRGRVEAVGITGAGNGADGTVSLTVGSTTTDCSTTIIGSSRVTYGDCIATGMSSTSNSGTSSVNVNSINGFGVNDEILIIQMAHASTNGKYEFRRVQSVAAGVITTTANLTNTYTVDGTSKAQVVRVPNFSSVTLTGTSSTLTVSDWDGTKGGILAFRVSGTLQIGSTYTIDLNGKGWVGSSAGSAGSAGLGCSGTCAGTNGGNGGAGTAGQGGGAGSSTGGGNAGNYGALGTGGTSTAPNTGGGGGGGGSGGGGGQHAGANAGIGGGGGGNGGTSPNAGTGGSGGSGPAAASTYGSSNLTTMFLGSGGGGGGGSGGGGGGGSTGTTSTDGGAGAAGGAGGDGGGIVYIEAATFNNAGTVRANGANGSAGSVGTQGVDSSARGAGGGGGGGAGGGAGSGGSVYIQTSNLTTGTITSSGGTGGASNDGGRGGNSTGGVNGSCGGGGGGGKTGGAAGTNVSGCNSGSATAGTTAAASGGAGGDGIIRCDTTGGTGCTTTPSANQNTYSGSSVNTYGTLYIGGVNTTSADLAEYYITGDKNIESGDVITISDTKVLDDGNQEVSTKGVLRKAGTPYDPKLLGIISTNPGLILGSVDGDTGAKDKRMLALSGRVPVKIDPDSQPIAVGDFLTSSDKPGLAMKATKAGYTVGKALEVWNPGGPDRIMVFVNLGYYDPDLALTDTGDLNVASVSGVYQITNGPERIIERIGAFSEAVMGTIRAGAISTQDLATEALTISGETLKDYIVRVVEEAIGQGQISPISPIGQISVDTITPISTESAGISVKLGPEQTFGIYNDQTASPAAVFDAQGNATIAGTLTADRIVTSFGDIDERIAGLEASLSAISTTPTPVVFDFVPESTDSAHLPAGEAGLDATSSALLQILEQQGVDTNGDNITLPGDFSVLGNTTLGPTSIAGSLLIDGSIYISNRGIESVLPDLNIMNGALVVNTLGDVSIKGNLTVGGTLAVNTISPIGQGDITADLSGGFGKFIIRGQENLAVASIDSGGNATFSGTLATSRLVIADSSTLTGSQSASLASNAVIGTGTLPAFETEVFIPSTIITQNSYIYITPISSTKNKVLYVKTKYEGEGFTVGMDTQISTEVTFNWWVIN